MRNVEGQPPTAARAELQLLRCSATEAVSECAAALPDRRPDRWRCRYRDDPKASERDPGEDRAPQLKPSGQLRQELLRLLVDAPKAPAGRARGDAQIARDQSRRSEPEGVRPERRPLEPVPGYQ